MSEAANHPDPPSPPPVRDVFRWVMGYVYPYWHRIAFAIALMGLYAGANALRLGMIALLFDGVIAPAAPTDKPGNLMGMYQEHVAPRLGERFEFKPQLKHHAPFVWLTLSEGEVEPDENDPNAVIIKNGVIASSELQTGPSMTGPFNAFKLRFKDPPDPNRAWIGERLEPKAATFLSPETGADRVLPILLAFGVIGVILALVIAFSNFGREYLARSIVVRLIAEIRADVFRHMSSLSLAYFQGKKSGELISRLTNDVAAVQISLRYVFGDVLQHPITMLSAIVMAFLASWQLALIASPFFILFLLPMLKSGKKVKRHGRGTLHKLGEVTQVMTQLLSGIRVVKAFRMEDAQEQEFRRKNAGFIRANLRMVRAKVTARSVMEGLYNFLAAVLLAFGGWLLVNQWFDLRLGDFAVFLSAVAMVYQPLKALTKAWNTLAESLAGAERVHELLAERPTVPDKPGAKRFEVLREQIEFREVSYRYGENEPWVLQQIDFAVKRGQTIALVGPSGAGKSTLLDLLARFYDPVQGSILLDGFDLRDGTHASLLEQTAIVSQDPFLFHESIRENIAHGRPGATEEQIMEAARAAAIHDDIMRFPDGYDEVIGDRGDKLSGGQRQRLTIARALLKNAAILILDEATSALDSESERQVQAALENLMVGRTTFVIAHRLSTIQHADRILVMESGRIVESGTHDELRGAGGPYSRLLEAQAASGQDRLGGSGSSDDSR